MASESDELGCAYGGSPYPKRKPRARCGVEGCELSVAPSRERKGHLRCYRHAGSEEKLVRDQKRRNVKRGYPHRTGRTGWQGSPLIYAALTAEEWQALWRSQAGLCVICLHPLRNRYDPRPQAGTRVAALDHDHAVESALKKAGVSDEQALRQSLRGLLCGFPCNRLLVRHWTPERLANAARYCAERPAQKVIRHGSNP